jgi:hypothetical protein
MSKEFSKKATVTVKCSWFSSNPVFTEVVAAVRRAITDPSVLPLEEGGFLGQLPSHNNGVPFTGYTETGPHTHITFEAADLASAVCTADALERFLRQEFPSKEGSPMSNFQGLYFTYGGKNLYAAVLTLENALSEARREIKRTRNFLPDRRLHKLRLMLDEAFHDLRVVSF